MQTLTQLQREQITQTSSLAGYFAALGQALPPLASRAALYASIGLGAPSTYAGTAEQNNRLLVELKRSVAALPKTIFSGGGGNGISSEGGR